MVLEWLYSPLASAPVLDAEHGGDLARGRVVGARQRPVRRRSCAACGGLLQHRRRVARRDRSSPSAPAPARARRPAARAAWRAASRRSSGRPCRTRCRTCSTSTGRALQRRPGERSAVLVARASRRAGRPNRRAACERRPHVPAAARRPSAASDSRASRRRRREAFMGCPSQGPHAAEAEGAGGVGGVERGQQRDAHQHRVAVAVDDVDARRRRRTSACRDRPACGCRRR